MKKKKPSKFKPSKVWIPKRSSVHISSYTSIYQHEWYRPWYHIAPFTVIFVNGCIMAFHNWELEMALFFLEYRKFVRIDNLLKKFSTVKNIRWYLDVRPLVCAVYYDLYPVKNGWWFFYSQGENYGWFKDFSAMTNNYIPKWWRNALTQNRSSICRTDFERTLFKTSTKRKINRGQASCS